MVGAELLELCAFLIGARTGDNSAAVCLHHLHRRGADAAARAQHQNKVVGLHVAVGEQHAIDRAVVRRNGGGLDKGKARIQRDDEVLRNAAVLRERALDLLTHHAFVRQRIDQTAIAHLPTLDLRSNGGDFAGGICTRNPRHWHRQAGHAASHEDIEIVQTYGLAADENVSRADDGIGKFAIDDIFNAALLLDDCSFHLTPRLIAAGPAVGWLLKRFIGLVNNSAAAGSATPHDACL